MDKSNTPLFKQPWDESEGSEVLSGRPVKGPKALPVPVKALLVAGNLTDQTALVEVLRSTPNLNLDSFPINQINQEVLSHTQLLILLVPNNDRQAITLIQNFAGRCDNMLILGKEASPEVLRTAMQSGANDFIPLEAEPEELTNAVYKVATSLADSMSLAPTIAVVNAKGGAGASFLAASIADELAQRSSSRNVALLDGDHLHGSQMLLLDSKPQYYFHDALTQVEDLDDTAITGLMSQMGNIHLLPTLPFSQMDSGCFQFQNLPTLMFKIRTHYSSVTVDLSRGPDHWSLPILTDAQHILLVIQDSIACLRDAATAIRYFTMQLGIPKERIHIIFNRYTPSRSQISLADVKETVGINSVYTVRNDFKRVSACVDEGKRLSEFAAKEAITKDIKAICDDLLPPDDDSQKASLWDKLWRR
ncbi:MinD/ParA family protein [Ferrimonas sediminicola]|uniref:MinD/ParA family protein n=1 Tax=Ferrimonas sediminicola TaxID=2569538 RepID=A0A4U1BG79_9GAMM|nr:MinD/ParA family protein [Ferrimonas sediminicola]TKB49963.1 MinD/ParA family protein [Ferrimonas sediminicola]